MNVRMCPRCGHDGRELQGEAGLRLLSCPNCHGDMYSRPPRSYAEMEGLDAAARHSRIRAYAGVETWAGPTVFPPHEDALSAPATALQPDQAVSAGRPGWRVAARRIALGGLLLVAAAILLAAGLIERL